MAKLANAHGSDPCFCRFESCLRYQVEFDPGVWYNTSMGYKDPGKRKQYAHDWHLANSEARSIYRRDRRQRLKGFVDLLKDKCEICGYNKCKEALDFHHLDPNDKVEALGQMIRDQYSDKAILEEIKKCILICSNCHREITTEERKNKLS